MGLHMRELSIGKFPPLRNLIIVLIMLVSCMLVEAWKFLLSVLPISLNVTATDVSVLITSVTANMTAAINLPNRRLIALKTNLFAPKIDDLPVLCLQSRHYSSGI